MFVRFLLLCLLAHPHFCFRAMAASGDTGHALGMSCLAGACFRAWQELVGGVGRLCVIVRMAHHLEDGLFSAASDDGFISPSVAIDDSILEPKTAVAAVDHLRLYDERCRSAVRFGSGFSAASLADIKSASESKDRSRGCGLSLLPTRNLDDDTQGVLKKGTYEERIANRTTMEAKRDCILAAIAAKAKMPDNLKDAKKRLRWLKKHIAKENEALDKCRQLMTTEWIKMDKAAEQRRQKQYERQDRLQHAYLTGGVSGLQHALMRPDLSGHSIDQSGHSTGDRSRGVSSGHRESASHPQPGHSTRDRSRGVCRTSTIRTPRKIISALSKPMVISDDDLEDALDEQFKHVIVRVVVGGWLRRWSSSPPMDNDAKLKLARRE